MVSWWDWKLIFAPRILLEYFVVLSLPEVPPVEEGKGLGICAVPWSHGRGFLLFFQKEGFCLPPQL